MERRIFGLENEYGITFTLRGQRRLSPDEAARYLLGTIAEVVEWVVVLTQARQAELACGGS